MRFGNLFFVFFFVFCCGLFVGLEFIFQVLTRGCSADFTGTNSTAPCPTAGWIGVASSVVAFGSFALPMKAQNVLEAGINPIEFQLYMSFAVFLSSFLILITTPWSFTWWGVASASLWVPTSLLSQVAVKFIGISVGQATWAGVTVIISFIWGVAIFHETPNWLGMALFGLVLILVGITGLSICNTDPVKSLEARRVARRKKRDHDEERLLNSSDVEAVTIPVEQDVKENGPMSSRKMLFIGVLAAFGTGLFNGSMLVPSKLVPADPPGLYTGSGFIVSFGFGVAIVTPALSIAYWIIACIFFSGSFPKFQLKAALLPAMSCGVMWSIGNFGSIYATQYIGLAVGFSLTQTALMVAGIWGITLLREIRGLFPISIWVISALILLGGSTLLALYGSSN